MMYRKSSRQSTKTSLSRCWVNKAFTGEGSKMADGMDDRRKGLEEEYFHRKNKEAIEKLRAKMKVAEAAKKAGTSSMHCPRCDGNLKESKFQEILIDTCEKWRTTKHCWSSQGSRLVCSGPMNTRHVC